MKKMMIPEKIRNQVQDIYLYHDHSTEGHSLLPFYADGSPGIIYAESEHATATLPEKKDLTPLFMYGQTMHPITLRFNNPYLLLIFRIDPLTGFQILNSDSSQLLNDCLDLTDLFERQDSVSIHHLKSIKVKQKIHLISDFISAITTSHDDNLFPEIQKALQLILEHNGNIAIKTMLEQLFISERTFQRQFRKVVGVAPKQLAQIVKYHTSKKSPPFHHSEPLLFITESYTDQSHFIKQFKRYSGRTPANYLRYLKDINHEPLD